MARKLPFRSMSPEVMPGAEAWSVTGGPVGALVLHGLGGTPATVRPVGDALARAGLSVAVPRLPGHGTVIDDLVPTRFADWSVAAGHALEELAALCTEVVVVGQSMGATLACGLVARHPEVTGLVAVNPLVRPVDAELVALVGLMLASGDVVADGDGPDLADPRATELSYRGTPLALCCRSTRRSSTSRSTWRASPAPCCS
ncbi:MAG TPA: alpha/beta fold hydrolase [Acidimicrobiales bacterium]|nr:alpha/beta fold hydrolase [Acidimicrobiales bacterium]